MCSYTQVVRGFAPPTCAYLTRTSAEVLSYQLSAISSYGKIFLMRNPWGGVLAPCEIGVK